MTTTAAISPVIRNVLSVATIPSMAVTASQMARITPRIAQIIRPMCPVCALAGFPAGYRGLTREAYVLDLRQFANWYK